jgi:hypothetical protein
VAVPEGSPWRLLCNAGPICDVVGSERACTGRDGEGRLEGAQQQQ